MSEARVPDSTRRPVGRLHARVSPVGFGCYRVDDRVPRHREALRLALLSGVNLVDTSTNYGDGHSELLVGKVLKELAAAGEVKREDVVVVTKAGYVQGQNLREAHERQRLGDPWREMTEYSRDCWHCISPEFLKDQLSASLGRLAMPRVDLFLLHNPEYFLTDAEHRRMPLSVARDTFYERVGRAFEQLEREVAAGRIGAYGISSNTFVAPHGKADAVDLLRVLELAGPGFAAIQLPMNPVELGAREPIHTVDGRSVLDVAREHELAVLVNRPLNGFRQGQLHRFAAAGPPFTLVPSASPDALAEFDSEETVAGLTEALRAILGTMTVEEVYRDRDAFAQRVQEVAAGDLANMGLTIISFTIRDIRDEEGYLDSLGKARTAEVKRDAAIGEANAQRDARIQVATACAHDQPLQRRVAHRVVDRLPVDDGTETGAAAAQVAAHRTEAVPRDVHQPGGLGHHVLVADPVIAVLADPQLATDRLRDRIRARVVRDRAVEGRVEAGDLGELWP